MLLAFVISFRKDKSLASGVILSDYNDKRNRLGTFCGFMETWGQGEPA
jgi:hypothetical protein